MNTKRSDNVRRALVTALRTLALSCAGVFAANIFAQPVLVTPPTVPPPPPPAFESTAPTTIPTEDTNAPASTTFTETGAAGPVVSAPQSLPFQWGPITLHP